MRIQLAMIDSEKNYAKKLIGFLTTHYLNDFSVTLCEDAQQFLKHVDQEKVDIVLAEPSLWDEDIQIPKQCQLIYYTTSADVETIRNQPAIYRFQRIENIVTELRYQYSQKHKDITSYRTKSSGRMITFAGAHGGSGNTTAAVACAMNLAMRRNRVLYLDLQTFGDATCFLDNAKDKGMSELLFAANNHMQNLSLQMEKLCSTDSSDVWYFSPFRQPSDVVDMDNNSIEKILDAALVSDRIQYVIVDTDGADLRKNEVIFRKSDKIVWTVRADRQERAERVLCVLEEIDEMDGTESLRKSELLLTWNHNKEQQPEMIRGNHVIGQISHREGSSREIAGAIAASSLFDHIED